MKTQKVYIYNFWLINLEKEDATNNEKKNDNQAPEVDPHANLNFNKGVSFLRIADNFSPHDSMSKSQFELSISNSFIVDNKNYVTYQI